MVPLKSAGAIGACTWFEGRVLKASEYLKINLTAMMKGNPWLCGSIIKRERKNHLAYNTEFSAKSVDEQFLLVPESDIFMDDPESATKFASHREWCQRDDPSEPVFKVTVVPCSENPEKMLCCLCLHESFCW